MSTAHAELTLAHPHHPLGTLGLDPDPERVSALDAAIDAGPRWRPVADVLAELDSLNDRISDALEALPRRGRGVRLDA